MLETAFPKPPYLLRRYNYEQFFVHRTGVFEDLPDSDDVRSIAYRYFRGLRYNIFTDQSGLLQGVDSGDTVIGFPNDHFLGLSHEYPSVVISTGWRGPPATEKQAQRYVDFTIHYLDSVEILTEAAFFD